MMPRRPQPSNDFERDLLARIDKFGWTVNSIFEPGGNHMPFCYSIGIYETLRAPELLIAGLKPDVGPHLVNDYGDRLRRGETFVPGRRYGDFVDGYDIVLLQADPVLASKDYTLSARWLYGGTDFPLLQLVWPDTRGRFPWEAGYAGRQPLVGAPPV